MQQRRWRRIQIEICIRGQGIGDHYLGNKSWQDLRWQREGRATATAATEGGVVGAEGAAWAVRRPRVATGRFQSYIVRNVQPKKIDTPSIRKYTIF
jgi:hypothetical protein